MCGIIGFASPVPNPKLLSTLIEESSIRGLHATGFSYLQDGILVTWIYKGPAEQAKKHIPPEVFSSSRVLGHFRYSTSDLEYNQPISDESVSIIHNGVVSQADPSHWGQLYGLRCEGKNDSELILRATLAGQEPLQVFPEASMAVCQLNKDTLSFYRNGKRPIWYHHSEGCLIVASTKDILKRSSLEGGLECKPGVRYTFKTLELQLEHIVDVHDDWQHETL